MDLVVRSASCLSMNTCFLFSSEDSAGIVKGIGRGSTLVPFVVSSISASGSVWSFYVCHNEIDLSA